MAVDCAVALYFVVVLGCISGGFGPCTGYLALRWMSFGYSAMKYAAMEQIMGYGTTVIMLIVNAGFIYWFGDMEMRGCTVRTLSKIPATVKKLLMIGIPLGLKIGYTITSHLLEVSPLLLSFAALVIFISGASTILSLTFSWYKTLRSYGDNKCATMEECVFLTVQFVDHLVSLHAVCTFAVMAVFTAKDLARSSFM